MHEKLQQIGDRTTCAMAVIVRDGRVLLGLRHYKDASVWICPGGRCDEGETIETTLRREVEEEVSITNLEIAEHISDVAGVNAGDATSLFLCYTQQEPRLMEPHKFSEWRWFDKNDFPDDFIDNEGARKIILGLLK